MDEDKASNHNAPETRTACVCGFWDKDHPERGCACIARQPAGVTLNVQVTVVSSEDVCSLCMRSIELAREIPKRLRDEHPSALYGPMNEFSKLFWRGQRVHPCCYDAISHPLNDEPGRREFRAWCELLRARFAMNPAWRGGEGVTDSKQTTGELLKDLRELYGTMKGGDDMPDLEAPARRSPRKTSTVWDDRFRL